MQTVKEIQALLNQAGAKPQRRYGQCFLIDLNTMRKLLEIADLPAKADSTVLEVGPGTGSLTEELLQLADKVVAVEIDNRLAHLLRRRLIDNPTSPAEQQQPCRGKFVLIESDVLANKRKIAPDVLAELAPSVQMVANLPYSIATPLVAESMLESWRTVAGRGGTVLFDSLTFTVQREVAERFAASSGREYGQASVILSLLGKVTLGPVISASAFWPKPKIDSQIVRIDFDVEAAKLLNDAETLQALLEMTFTQRRKKISSTTASRSAPFQRDLFAEAVKKTGIDSSARADHLPPEAYLKLANELTIK